MAINLANEGKDTPRVEIGAIAHTPLKAFPYWPPQVTLEEMMRTEVMMELNKWANNDPFMAKRAAETLVLLLSNQFDLNLIQLQK